MMYFTFLLSFIIILVIPCSYADFNDDVLAEHNRLRKKHGSPDLVLDSELTNGCQSYAEELAQKDIMKHSTGGDYGENLCFTTGDKLKCVQDWYDEIKDYDYGKPDFSMKTGHFTALVWKASTNLGVGSATNDESKKIYVVARYTPAGNVKGKFAENVPKLINGSNSRINGNESIIPIIMLLTFSWLFKKIVN